MLLRFLFFCTACFGGVVFASGQTLSGLILDSNGGAVPGAAVYVDGNGITGERKTVSDPVGEFTFRDLKFGVYRLKATAVGFQVWTSDFTVDGDSNIEIILEPKSVAEIVSVTSNYLAGTEEALLRTPGSIHTIGRKELESSRVFNFDEALRKVSGVNVRNEEGFGLRPNISIRGSDPTRSRKVLLLEDGIPLSFAPYGDNASYYHPPVERFESIEVLKGSGQIEYGPVTVAGVVNYVTPSPPEKTSASIKLTGGNRDYFNGSLSFGSTFSKTGFISNFTRKQGQGSRENLKAGVNDFSLKVVQTFNDSNVAVFKYSHFDESSRLTYSGLTEAEFRENPRQNPFQNDDLEFFREGFSATHTGILGRNAFINTTFYSSYFSRDWWRQSSNSSQRPNRLGLDPDCRSMLDLNTTCGNQGTPRDYRTNGIEPRFTMNFDTGKIRNQFSAGIRLHYETQDRRGYNGSLPNSREEGSEITERNYRTAFAFSTYVQNRFKWNKISVTPGIRWESVSYTRSNLLNQSSAETRVTQLIPGIGISYNPFSNVTIFTGIHRGFSPPSTADILTNSGGIVELDSELSWNFEFGIRTRLSKWFSAEGTYFRNDYENQIIPASVAGGTGATNTNAGATIQEGFEFTGRFDSGPLFKTDFNLYLQTAATFLSKAEFLETRHSAVSGFSNILVTGNRLPYVPGYQVTSAVGFQLKRIDAFLEANNIGTQFTDDLNTINPIPSGQRGAIPAQTYLNATMNYKIERLKSTLFITSKNLTDRLFIVDRTRGIYPGMSRLVQAGFRIDF